MSGSRIPEEILDVIRAAENFVVVTHVQPDGDAVGSLLAMSEMLKDMGKRVFAFLDEPISHLYDFMPGCGRLNSDAEEMSRFIAESGTDICVIALDCGEADRIGRHRELLMAVSPFVVIDHHLSHLNFGDHRWVDPRSSSTGEMVYEIIEALSQTPSYDCAFSLYVAICTDTGSFRYECTGPRTFEIAGKLVELGVRPNHVAGLLYENYSPQRLKLMQMVLGTLELCEDGQIACIHVTRDMFDESGAKVQDIEGFIEYARSISSVKVAVFIKQTWYNMVSASLRAKGGCNVADIAKQFGGGGHRNASGCKFPGGTIESVRQQILPAVIDAIASGGDRNSC
ncbi:MAG: bifunctional oligoribonuclease/PAP phosphatase NrnA [Desulfofustis sp.]|nr:bifunctional oligoribonuclease/PAP phosphatase NrnA [Desulfofustis sp.]